MKEMNHWLPVAILRHFWWREWSGLKRIDTTLVSSRRTLTSAALGVDAGSPESAHEMYRPLPGDQCLCREVNTPVVWLQERGQRARANSADRRLPWPCLHFNRNSGAGRVPSSRPGIEPGHESAEHSTRAIVRIGRAHADNSDSREQASLVYGAWQRPGASASTD